VLKVILAMIASLSMSGSALAFSILHPPEGNGGSPSHDHDHDHGPGGGGPVAAPEIDPASAVSALTLLMGGLAVVRGRKTKN
jgi:hypothetical protein